MVMSDWFATLAWLKSEDMLRDTDSQIHSNHQWLYTSLIQRPAHIHHCLALALSFSPSVSLALERSRSVWIVSDTQREEGLSEEWPCAMPSIHQPSFSPQERWMKAKKGREGERKWKSKGERKRYKFNVLHPTYAFRSYQNSKNSVTQSFNQQVEHLGDWYKPWSHKPKWQTEMINTSTHTIILEKLFS